VATDRNFIINGECLVQVKGGAHNSGRALGSTTELGLSQGQIVVTYHFSQKDIPVDDFGPDTPADVLALATSLRVRIPLIHTNRTALDACLRESMGGGGASPQEEGVLGPARLLGRNKPLRASGNLLLCLILRQGGFDGAPLGVLPWRMPACHLTSPPVEFPLGVGVSLIQTHWRAIPYTPMVSGEIRVSGVILYDRDEEVD
jgi:hypothetical protein